MHLTLQAGWVLLMHLPVVSPNLIFHWRSCLDAALTKLTAVAGARVNEPHPYVPQHVLLVHMPVKNLTL